MAEKWTVVGQEETTIADRLSGGYVRAVRVRFLTEMGNVGTVDVPKDSYSVDAARTAIDKAAATLDEISAL